jgi:hypothetical protein
VVPSENIALHYDSLLAYKLSTLYSAQSTYSTYSERDFVGWAADTGTHFSDFGTGQKLR